MEFSQLIGKDAPFAALGIADVQRTCKTGRPACAIWNDSYAPGSLLQKRYAVCRREGNVEK